MAEVVEAQAGSTPPGPIAHFFGASPLAAAARPAYRGALGELMVGDMLENLGSRWDVLHDLPLDSGVLDHLVIGPAGVFAVVVANYSERDVVVDDAALLIAGEPTDDIARTIEQADAAASLLSLAAGHDVRVRGMLVVVEPRKLVVKRPANGVRVVASQDLERVLTRAPRVLAGDEVAAVSDLADLESTWPTPLAAGLDTQRLHRDFAMVRHGVRSALLRRVLWGAVGFTVAYALVWTMVATLVTSVFHT
jgi:hypothetical protein